jgi:hypothetical protein
MDQLTHMLYDKALKIKFQEKPSNFGAIFNAIISHLCFRGPSGLVFYWNYSPAMPGAVYPPWLDAPA